MELVLTGPKRFSCYSQSYTRSVLISNLLMKQYGALLTAWRTHEVMPTALNRIRRINALFTQVQQRLTAVESSGGRVIPPESDRHGAKYTENCPLLSTGRLQSCYPARRIPAAAQPAASGSLATGWARCFRLCTSGDRAEWCGDAPFTDLRMASA